MFWEEKVAREERTFLKEEERDKNIMIHRHSKDVTNQEKETGCLNKWL